MSGARYWRVRESLHRSRIHLLSDQLTDTFTRCVSLTKPSKNRSMEGLLSVWGKWTMQRSVIVQSSRYSSVRAGDFKSGTSVRLRVRPNIIRNRHTLEVPGVGMDHSAVFLYVPAPSWRRLVFSIIVLLACLVLRDTEPVDKRNRIGEMRISDHRDDASVVSATGRERARGESQG